MRLVGRAACIVDVRNAYKILVGKPEGKRPLGRHNYRWEDNMKIHVKEIGCQHMGWIHVALGRISSIKGEEFLH
jgi:hypothetical protein